MDAEKKQEILQQILDEIVEISYELGKASTQIVRLSKKVCDILATNEKPEPKPEAESSVEAVQATLEEVPIVKSQLVHGVRMANYQPGRKFAICGAMGTPNQPFAARLHESITTVSDEVTCPDCLKILAEQEIS